MASVTVGEPAVLVEHSRVPLSGGWRELSAHYASIALDRTGIEDITVTVAPGAGRFGFTQVAPGWWREDQSLIGVEGGNLPAAPHDLDLSVDEHRRALAAMRGVLTHEIGHANHSAGMRPDEDMTASEAEAMRLLEEIRMEHQAALEYPDEKPFLRAAVAEHIFDGTEDSRSALGAVILLEGRVIGGSLDLDDIGDLPERISATVDQSLHEQILDLCAEAVEVADGDVEAMRDVSKRLASVVDLTASDPSMEDLLDEIFDVVSEIALDASDDPTARETLDKESDQCGVGDGSGAPAEVQITAQAPAGDLRSVRRRLADQLRASRTPGEVVTRVRRAKPPGKVLVRHIVRDEIQRRAGIEQESKPFAKYTRAVLDEAAPRMLVLVDASGSQSDEIGDVCEATFVVGGANVDAGGSTALIAFGSTAKVISTLTEDRAPKIRADALFEAIGDASILAEDQMSMLADTLGTRIVIVFSDGRWGHRVQAAAGDAYLRRLVESGAHVILANVGTSTVPVEHPCTELIAFQTAADVAPFMSRLMLRDAIRGAAPSTVVISGD